MQPHDKGQIYLLIVGAVVAQLRERHHLTQTQMAQRVGITQSTLSRIERGQAQAGPYEMRAFAEAFGMTTAEFHQTVEDAYRRAEDAARNATRAAKGKAEWWDMAFAVLGIIGLAGLVTFAVAAVLGEEEKKRPGAGAKPAGRRQPT